MALPGTCQLVQFGSGTFCPGVFGHVRPSTSTVTICAPVNVRPFAGAGQATGTRFPAASAGPKHTVGSVLLVSPQLSVGNCEPSSSSGWLDPQRRFVSTPHLLGAPGLMTLSEHDPVNACVCTVGSPVAK